MLHQPMRASLLVFFCLTSQLPCILNNFQHFMFLLFIIYKIIFSYSQKKFIYCIYFQSIKNLFVENLFHSSKKPQLIRRSFDSTYHKNSQNITHSDQTQPPLAKNSSRLQQPPIVLINSIPKSKKAKNRHEDRRKKKTLEKRDKQPAGVEYTDAWWSSKDPQPATKNYFLAPHDAIFQTKTKSTSDLNPSTLTADRSKTQKQLHQSKQQKSFPSKEPKRDYFNDDIDEFVFNKKYCVKTVNPKKEFCETRIILLKEKINEKSALNFNDFKDNEGCDDSRKNVDRTFDEKKIDKKLSISPSKQVTKNFQHKSSIEKRTRNIHDPGKKSERNINPKNMKFDINFDLCDDNKKWSSAEFNEEKSEKLLVMMDRRRVHSCEIPAFLEDSYMFTEFIDGPYDDGDNANYDWNPLSGKRTFNFSFPSVNTDLSSTSEAHAVSQRNDSNSKENLKKQKILKTAFKPKLTNTKSNTVSERTGKQEKKFDWKQDSKAKRQHFGKAFLERNKRHSSFNSSNALNSFDSVTTENEASGSSSRCGATTTSMESTATNASSDSTTDSKSHKLHQMRDDSGYKSLETQQSLKKIENNDFGALQKTSQMFKFVAQKASSATKSFDILKSAVTNVNKNQENIRSESLEEKPLRKQDITFDCNKDKLKTYTIEKPSFLSKRASILFGFQSNKYPVNSDHKLETTLLSSNIHGINQANETPIAKQPQAASNTNFFKNNLNQQNHSLDIIQVYKNDEKVILRGNSFSNSSQLLEPTFAPQKTPLRFSSTLDPTDSAHNKVETSTEKFSNRNFFSSHFNLMLHKAESYISGGKCQSDEPKNINSENSPEFKKQTASNQNSNNEKSLFFSTQMNFFPNPLPSTTNSTPTVSIKSRWRLAAKLVGDSWNKANSLPETVENIKNTSFRSNSDSVEISGEREPLKQSLSEKLEQQNTNSESHSMPTIPNSLRLQKILEEQNILRNQLSLTDSKDTQNLNQTKSLKNKIPLSPLLGKSSHSQLTLNPQKSQQTFHLEPSQLEAPQEIKISISQSPQKPPIQFLNNFSQNLPIITPPTDDQTYSAGPKHQVNTLTRGDPKSASKRRKAYRTRKKLNDRLMPYDDEQSSQQTQSSSNNSKPSFSFSTSASANEDLASNTAKIPSENLSEQNFIKRASERMIYRDYSVDARTEAIFNEFIQYDPQLERPRESFLFVKDSKGRKKIGCGKSSFKNE